MPQRNAIINSIARKDALTLQRNTMFHLALRFTMRHSAVNEGFGYPKFCKFTEIMEIEFET
ncbi:MAG: hypothetical protein CMM54_05985 [Rhodospirillaceae bacterium]|nr:hypothetical protein [Rhodospirillaceae bacterium]